MKNKLKMNIEFGGKDKRIYGINSEDLKLLEKIYTIHIIDDGQGIIILKKNE